MKKKIAVFRHIELGFDLISEEVPTSSDYTRISEWIEVDFPESDVSSEIASIDAEIKAIKADASSRAYELREKKKLLMGAA